MTRRLIIMRIALFPIVFIALQWWWVAVHETTLEYVVIHHAVVQPAAWLINLFTPDAHAVAVRFSVLSAGGGLNILNGCEGMDVVLLLLSAFLVAPLSIASRMHGMMCGIATVFVINQARILILFYAYRANRQWFDVLHSTVTPVMVVLLVVLFFYAWLFNAQRHTQPA